MGMQTWLACPFLCALLPSSCLQCNHDGWGWEDIAKIWGNGQEICRDFYPESFFFPNWSIADLQYCVNFCCTIKWLSYTHMGLPCWLRWQRIHLQCRKPGFDHWVGKIPWRREWLPNSVYFAGESHGQRILVAIIHGVANNQTWLNS